MNLVLLVTSSPFSLQNLPQIIMFASLIAVFYFFMIRPQSQKMKDQKTFIDKLQKGDRVITQSGIHGKIVEVDPTYFMVEVDHNVRIKFDRSAISMELSEPLNKVKISAIDTK
jgi:preprotein translocase subunit YajC